MPAAWTEFFFYPILQPSCPICALPGVGGDCCVYCRRLNLPREIRSGAYLSYTWRHSRSPAYAFKTRENFEQDLRDEITRLFGWMAHSRFSHMADSAFVIGVPPRTTLQWECKII
jgi:hypothetical protein